MIVQQQSIVSTPPADWPDVSSHCPLGLTMISLNVWAVGGFIHWKREPGTDKNEEWKCNCKFGNSEKLEHEAGAWNGHSMSAGSWSNLSGPITAEISANPNMFYKSMIRKILKNTMMDFKIGFVCFSSVKRAFENTELNFWFLPSRSAGAGTCLETRSFNNNNNNNINNKRNGSAAVKIMNEITGRINARNLALWMSDMEGFREESGKIPGRFLEGWSGAHWNSTLRGCCEDVMKWKLEWPSFRRNLSIISILMAGVSFLREAVNHGAEFRNSARGHWEVDGPREMGLQKWAPPKKDNKTEKWLLNVDYKSAEVQPFMLLTLQLHSAGSRNFLFPLCVPLWPGVPFRRRARGKREGGGGRRRKRKTADNNSVSRNAPSSFAIDR